MLFLIIVLSTLALIHGYVGFRIIPTLGFIGSWQGLAWLLLSLLTIMPILPILLRFLGYENGFIDALSWIVYTSLGFFTLTFLVVVFRDLGWIAWTAGTSLVTWLKEHFTAVPDFTAEYDPSRRRFLIYAMNLGLLSATGTLSAYGLFQARRKPTVIEVDIPIADLPFQLEGLRIVQISDLHVGPTIKRNFVQRVADQVQALNPDLIALTGDLVEGSVNYLNGDVAPLADLEAPYGKWFVTGNHEYYSGVEHWLEVIDGLGFTCLENEHRVVDVNGAKLTIAGVNDLSSHHVGPNHISDPDAALAGTPDDSLKLLLAHQPGSVFDAQRLGVHLQLSGHTHGGQFRPFDYAVAQAHPYVSGLHNHNGTWIYVNSGTGYWGPPLRLGVPSEITVVRLMKA
ncbi:MAG: metallophosphoesterase [Candidatus Marinimicrobia bacterium]|nr:metallophosphoesterase [Candidatus Neomarinimicrobiota bacterium]